MGTDAVPALDADCSYSLESSDPAIVSASGQRITALHSRKQFTFVHCRKQKSRAVRLHSQLPEHILSMNVVDLSGMVRKIPIQKFLQRADRILACR